MEKDKTYIIRIEVNGRELVYHATIISIDENFITFVDKFGKKISVNKKNIQTYEEVGE